MEHYQYKVEDISDIKRGPPAFAARNYVEQNGVRYILKTLEKGDCAAEIGCGYGRITPVLTEFYTNVFGYERQKELCMLASTYVPNISFVNIKNLFDIPASSASFDLVLTYTALQHISDVEIPYVINEMRRIIKVKGYALLVEDTTNANPDQSNPLVQFCVGRSVDRYSKLMNGFKLVSQTVRPSELNSDSVGCGTTMLFQKI